MLYFLGSSVHKSFMRVFNLIRYLDKNGGFHYDLVRISLISSAFSLNSKQITPTIYF